VARAASPRRVFSPEGTPVRERSRVPSVNPEILIWARENAGLTLSEAAIRLEIGSARGAAPKARLEALERGEWAPSRPLLLRMAKQYRRPLLLFYLPVPPRRVTRGNDFRTLPQESSRSEAMLLDALLRDVRARQAIVRDALEGIDEAEELPFVGSAQLGMGAATVANKIQGQLGFELTSFRSRPGAPGAFAYLREAAEASGCFVLLIGDLGSHHSALDVDTFRGFALADAIAPFVIINDHDARSAWSFTLLHELAHIWLGQTGISGGRADLEVERFCNDVAASILLPPADLATLRIEPRQGVDKAIATIGSFAAERNISSSMVAYRLFLEGRLDRRRWSAISERLGVMWSAERDRTRARSREQEGGPNYFVVKRHRIGASLVGAVSRFLSSGELSTSQAGKVLGVRAKLVGKLLGLDSARSIGDLG
jgi:Zn-dependent peptidase ImmA (M78 family)/transcriptional regulator with XRE-family HTH domain